MSEEIYRTPFKDFCGLFVSKFEEKRSEDGLEHIMECKLREPEPMEFIFSETGERKEIVFKTKWFVERIKDNEITAVAISGESGIKSAIIDRELREPKPNLIIENKISGNFQDIRFRLYRGNDERFYELEGKIADPPRTSNEFYYL